MPEALGVVLLLIGLLAWRQLRRTSSRSPFSAMTKVYRSIALLFTVVGVGLILEGITL